MSTYLSRYFLRRRQELRITLGDLARRCGYTNISKGANRINRFEERGEIAPPLLASLVTTLEITCADIERCLTQDCADWERWAKEPIVPYLVVKMIPGVYSWKSIPLGLKSNRQNIEQFASDFAKSHSMAVCLVLSRKLHVWFDGNGTMTDLTEDTFEEKYGPYMSIGGKKILTNILDLGLEVSSPLE